MAATGIPMVYDPVWKTFHWLTVLLVVALLAIGWTMSGPVLFMWHASLGVTLLAVMLARFFWRATHPVPPVPAALRPWEIKVLVIVQVLFYVLLLAQPLLGWALYSLAPSTTRFFGLTTLPRLPFFSGPATSTGVRALLEGAHATIATLLAGLVVLHAGAAMKHHFVIRDDVLLRMAPRSLGPFLSRLRGQ